LEEKLKASNHLIIQQRHSFELKAEQNELEMSKLRKDLENERDAAEQKIMFLLEKQKDDSPVTAVQHFCLNKEEELSSQIQIMKETIEARDNIIVGMQKENGELKTINKSTEEKQKDAEDKILQLDEELKDEKEGYKQLKSYIGEILRNILSTQPQIFERK
jgi:chromosome segregation ATPase